MPVPLESLRAKMAELGLDAMMLRHNASIRWLTGFTGVFDSEEAHTAIVTRDEALIHTDSRYATAFEACAQGGPWSIVMGDEPCFDAGWRVGIEDDISLREYRHLCERLGDAVELVETRDLILGLREVKTQCELELIRAACRITDATFEHMCAWLRPGVTERQAALELERFMNEAGSQMPSFATIVCAGANAASPHHIPNDTVIEKGDLVLMDFGAVVDDYHADMTRVVAMGQPSEHQQHIYDIVRQANEVVQAYLAPGVTGIEAHQLAASIIATEGYGEYFGHGLGHGVGLQIHESPNLNTRNGRELVPGNVVTVEPGIYLPGDLGVRLEDMGVITAGGFESFYTSTHELVVIDC
ncbi:MAG: aminopeptidase P family protein [Coriobacteriales bacterium]|nr:aminopeptidase P family protein [Coriobacteriales bacterium]MBQ6586248.1 aminopeptidase P family protein [Coriobacteriales bacterium]